MPTDLITSAQAAAALPSVDPVASAALIASLVTAVSRAIESWCRRTFAAAHYDELADGDGTGILLTRQHPIVSVLRVSASPTVVLTVSNSDTTNSRAIVQIGNYPSAMARVGPAPAPTVTASTASGSLPAGTYGFLLTLVDSWGEGPASQSSIQVLASTGQITIPSPAAYGVVTLYRVYAQVSGGAWFLQNGAGTPIGTSYVQNVPLNTTTAGPPGFSTGLSLTRYTSGGQPVLNGNLSYWSNPTAALMAAAINALGHSWTATVQGTYGAWPTIDFAAMAGAKGALGSNQALIKAHVQDLGGWSVDEPIGEVSLSGDGDWFGWPFNAGPVDWTTATANEGFPHREKYYRLAYAAGYAAGIPDDVMQAAIYQVQTWYYESQRDGGLSSLSVEDLNWQRLTPTGLDVRVQKMLAPYRVALISGVA